jgi:hypothetical protein
VGRAPQPGDGSERAVLVGWLEFSRDALLAKCEGVPAERLVERSAPPSALSLLGLVRHLSEMERVYVHDALGPAGGTWHLRYATEEDPEGGIEGLTVADVGPSLAAYDEDRRASDDLLTGADMGARASGNGLTVRWNVQKLLAEYARHLGHADLLRERIDGSVGE